MTRPLLIDTDPGVDDAVAILLALASPELSLRAVCTVAGNVGLAEATANALALLELAGQGEVAVHAGCPRPLLREQVFGRFHDRGGLESVLPRSVRTAAAPHAVQRLIELSHAVEKLTICAIGPMTNLAAALVLDPAIAAAWGRVVIMGGGFRVAGNRTEYAEFNALADPHALRILLASGAEVVMLPLDATHPAIATPARLAALRAAGRFGAVAAALLTLWDRGDPARFGGAGGPLHDPLTVAFLLAPELFRTQRVAVDVDCETPSRYGHTIADWHGQSGRAANATVVTGVDADAFFALLAARLARLG